MSYGDSGKDTCEYPKLSWPAAGWWATSASTLLAVALLVFPSITNLPPVTRILIAVALVLLFPLALAVLPCVSRAALTFVRRGRHFSRHVLEIALLKERLVQTESALNALVREREGRRMYEIDHCYAYGHRAFIALRRKPGPALPEGARIMVVDMQNYALMGRFVVRKVNQHYECEQEEYMDALWRGHVVNGGQHVPPEYKAMTVCENKGDGDE